MLVICYQVTSHPAIEGLPDSKSSHISIPYHLPCGLFKHFTSWVFVGRFEIDQTLRSQGSGSFNQEKIAGIFSRYHFQGNCLQVCFQMEMRDNCTWDVMQELVFCTRIRVLLSAFHFSVCNCGLNNGLWFLMEGGKLCML